MKIQILFLFILLKPACAFSSGSSGKGKADFIYQRSSDGHIAIWKLNGPWDNPDGCQDSSRLVIEGSNTFRDSFVSSVLSAKMADRDMGAFLVGCSDWNGVTHPTVFGIYNY
ncbi:MAG: hypothetical protein KZQ73_00670 [Candidatus Thiodiazotropha sp. (ex Semelilucina semeliformis)]|nr:hypothetical protein [Candidatus Thiodiazotropha sp. (ex Semelilucina semeliformis)]